MMTCARHRDVLCAVMLAGSLFACVETAPVSMQGVNVQMALGPYREMRGDRTGDGVRLTVQPSVRDGNWRLLTFEGYQASDVHHLGIVLKQGGNVIGTQTVNRLPDGSWLPVLFDNLRASSSYQVVAIAYQSANDALPISDEVVQTVNTGTNALVAVDIPISLLDRPVSATVSTNIQVTAGQWLDPGTAALGPVSGVVVSTVAGNGYPTGNLGQPTGICSDGSSGVYVSSSEFHRILKYDSAFTQSIFAGSGTSGTTDGTGTAASFSTPRGLARDGSGNLYVADRNSSRIRKVTTAGVVSVLAGSIPGSADNIGAMSAQFNSPTGVAVDASGTVYVADTNNHRIRRVNADYVNTLAGLSPGVGAGFNDGTGPTAQFNSPTGVAVDASGNVYVADQGNHCIRKVTAGSLAVSTIAGSAIMGSLDGTGTAAQFNGPYGICRDTAGNLYVTEMYGHRIRRITSSGVVTTIAGNGVAGYFDGVGTSARFNRPAGITVGNETATQVTLYVTEWGHRIRQIIVPKQ